MVSITKDNKSIHAINKVVHIHIYATVSIFSVMPTCINNKKCYRQEKYPVCSLTVMQFYFILELAYEKNQNTRKKNTVAQYSGTTIEVGPQTRSPTAGSFVCQ